MRTIATRPPRSSRSAPLQTVGNMTLFRSSPTCACPHYPVLDEALEARLGEVTTISGARPRLNWPFDNHADKKRVLPVDGEEFIGARQNRVLNISIRCRPGRKITIPVSCCEAGHWAYTRAPLHQQRQRAVRQLKIYKDGPGVGLDARHRRAPPDQGEIWSDIAKSAVPGARCPVTSGPWPTCTRRTPSAQADITRGFHPEAGQPARWWRWTAKGGWRGSSLRRAGHLRALLRAVAEELRASDAIDNTRR